jgi:GDP-4-dehydro-6-deoxy-D-mannose reductase
MRALVFGADGFIGRNVCAALEHDYDVIRATQDILSGVVNNVQVDLLDQESIKKVLDGEKPDVIINCAGIVNANSDTDLNLQFTKNIVEQVANVDTEIEVVICGSAGEYGRVSPENIPVREDAPLNADSGYGLSKLKEEKYALEYGKEHGIKVIVLRIFNPIGKDMADQFMTMRLVKQVREFRSGIRDSIEVTRLDSKRDYISIKDVASAFKAIVDGSPKYSVYNVGSGVSTTNKELMDLLLKNSNLDNMPRVKETSNEAEQLVAVCADISRISNEFGWHPTHQIEEVIKEICEV